MLWLECGKSPEDFNPVQASPLIHAGFNSTSGAFPWMAALYTSLEEGFWDQICGGTLITPSVVLTGIVVLQTLCCCIVRRTFIYSLWAATVLRNARAGVGPQVKWMQGLYNTIFAMTEKTPRNMFNCSLHG